MRQFGHAIEDISINSLKPYPRNARCHSKATQRRPFCKPAVPV